MKPTSTVNLGSSEKSAEKKYGNDDDDKSLNNIKDIYKNPEAKKEVLVEIYQAVSALYGKFFADIFRSIALSISNDEGLRHIGEKSVANMSNNKTIFSQPPLKRNERSAIDPTKKNRESTKEAGKFSESDFIPVDTEKYPKKNKIKSDISERDVVSGKNSTIKNSYSAPELDDIGAGNQKAMDEKRKIIREMLLQEYQELFGIQADIDMPDELLIAMIKRKREVIQRGDDSQKFSPESSHWNSGGELIDDQDADDDIPMDDDSHAEGDDPETDFGTPRRAEPLNRDFSKKSSSYPGIFFNPAHSEDFDQKMELLNNDARYMDYLRSEYAFEAEPVSKSSGDKLTDPTPLERASVVSEENSDSGKTINKTDAYPLPTSLYVDSSKPEKIARRRSGNFSQQSDSEGQVSEDTSRKLAELVNMNHFPNVDVKKLSFALFRKDFSAEFESIVSGVQEYFDSLMSNSPIDSSTRDDALALAKMWEGASFDERRLDQMKRLPDFSLIDRLLSSEKISRDFKSQGGSE